jgi:hypothetical protein
MSSRSAFRVVLRLKQARARIVPVLLFLMLLLLRASFIFISSFAVIPEYRPL